MAGTAFIVVFVSGITLMVVVNVVVIVWSLRRGFIERRRTSRVGEPADEEHGGGGIGLSAEELSELPSHGFKEGGVGDCAVCLVEFKDGDWCRALPRCEHRFHVECVDSWLRKSRLCPVCRAEVASPRKVGGDAAAEVVVARR